MHPVAQEAVKPWRFGCVYYEGGRETLAIFCISTHPHLLAARTCYPPRPFSDGRVLIPRDFDRRYRGERHHLAAHCAQDSNFHLTAVMQDSLCPPTELPRHLFDLMLWGPHQCSREVESRSVLYPRNDPADSSNDGPLLRASFQVTFPRREPRVPRHVHVVRFPTGFGQCHHFHHPRLLGPRRAGRCRLASVIAQRRFREGLQVRLLRWAYRQVRLARPPQQLRYQRDVRVVEQYALDLEARSNRDSRFRGPLTSLGHLDDAVLVCDSQMVGRPRTVEVASSLPLLLTRVPACDPTAEQLRERDNLRLIDPSSTEYETPTGRRECLHHDSIRAPTVSEGGVPLVNPHGPAVIPDLLGAAPPPGPLRTSTRVPKYLQAPDLEEHSKSRFSEPVILSPLSRHRPGIRIDQVYIPFLSVVRHTLPCSDGGAPQGACRLQRRSSPYGSVCIGDGSLECQP
jgi:hypothetical protein